MRSRSTGLALAIWWGWMPAVGLIMWAFVAISAPVLNWFTFSGLTWRQGFATFLRVQVFPAVNHPTPLFWLWVTVGLTGTAVILFAVAGEYGSDAAGGTGLIAGLVALGIFGGLVIPGFWHNKQEGQFYDRSLVVHILAKQPTPPSLYYLMQGVTMQDMNGPRHRCAYVADRHDVPSCTVIEDDLKAVDGYEGRTSPYAAAKLMMQNANTIPKVSARTETVNYLYGAKRDSGGAWTAILDGSGKQRHAYGVASWDGASNTVKTACAFNDGDDRFDRAFGGERGNNLRNWLADQYETLHYDLSDAWGYCRGDRPVYVLPVTRYVRFKGRAMSTAAGVLLLTGSRHGVQATYRRHVTAGELPGPVYPASLAAHQQDMVPWAAGRKYRDSFGFSPTDDNKIQGENTGEYVLRGQDGRLYFVTPLTPGNSTSQSFVAYGVTRADTVNDRQLNAYNLNVLPANDARITNLKTLDNVVANFVNADNPSFLNTGGAIAEITPLGGDMWRAFAVRNGQVAYYVDVSANNRITPKKVVVNSGAAGAPGAGQPTGGPPVTGGTPCAKAAAQMSRGEMADCLTAIAQRTRTLK